MGIQMTVRQMTNAWVALQSIQATPKIVREGGSDCVERVPAKFSVATRKLIRRQFQALQPFVQEFERERDDIIAEVTGGLAAIPQGGATLDPQRETLRLAREVNLRVRECLNVEHCVEVEPLSETDLNLSENPISGETIDLLRPLYDD